MNSFESTYKSLVILAIDHLLEAELREENGWTKREIEMLKELSNGEFEINFQHKQKN